MKYKLVDTLFYTLFIVKVISVSFYKKEMVYSVWKSFQRISLNSWIHQLLDERIWHLTIIHHLKLYPCSKIPFRIYWSFCLGVNTQVQQKFALFVVKLIRKTNSFCQQMCQVFCIFCISTSTLCSLTSRPTL